MRVAAFAAALVVAGHMSAAGAEPRLTVEPDQTHSDTALLQDEAKAASVFQQRLRDQVSVTGGMLVIEDRGGGATSVTIVPATIAWAVDCSDSGLNVTFGSGSADTDIGVSIQLTAVPIPVEKCRKIAPAIGTAVLALTRGQ
jgi:hypothetical protein